MEREYELMYIVRPDLDEDQVRTAMDEVTSMVAGNGGEVLKSSLWGRRRLAYLVGGFHDGYYVVADTRLPGERLGEIERQLKLSETVIRHMLTIARPLRDEGERPPRGRERWRDRERGRGRRGGEQADAAPGETPGADAEATPAEATGEGPEAAPAPEPAEALAGAADQAGTVEGPQMVDSSAAPAAGREETDVPHARAGADDLDDDDSDDAEDDDDEALEDEDDDDDDDGEEA